MIKRFDVTSNPVKLAEQLNRILNSIDADLRENKQAGTTAVTTATSAMEGIAAIQGSPTPSAQPVVQPQSGTDTISADSNVTGSDMLFSAVLAGPLNEVPHPFIFGH